MGDLLAAFGRLDVEQKAAAVGAVLLAVSTFGPFSFVEAAEILVALGVLALLRARALGRGFHLPFGDGTVIASAGAWAAVLIVVRLLDRPLGQNLLALACAAILVAAGVRERAKRPPEDVRGQTPTPSPHPSHPPRGRGQTPSPAGEENTEPLPPPEFEPHRPKSGEQLRLGPEQRPREPGA